MEILSVFNKKIRLPKSILNASFVLYLIFTFTGLGCSSVPSKSIPVLQTVSYVDLDRYLGKWYEIARYPHSFEEGCFGPTAFYEKLANEKIRVTNQCRQNSPTGELNEAIGMAEIIDDKSNAKLEVQFFWPFTGNYWIIDLDENYQYAIVSEPNRQYLWILSRLPKMEEALLNKLKRKLTNLGFDLTYLSLSL
jgi:apolipoprotein D and lipocalin family protein